MSNKHINLWVPLDALRLIMFLKLISNAGFAELHNSGSTQVGPYPRANEIFVMDVCDIKLLKDML